MKISHRHHDMAEINITPMIDVLLVLLILFLVIQPALRKGIDLQLPGDRAEASEGAEVDQIVLHVRAGPTYTLNQLPVPAEELEARLAEIFSGRTRKVLFLRGHDGARYGELLEAADRSRGAGVEVLGLVLGAGAPALTE